MIPKPPGCSGCPFEHSGAYYVPDEPERGQALTIMMQNPGADEECGRQFLGWSGGGERWGSVPPRPAIGKSGYDLTQNFLPLAGLTRENVRVCNAVRCRVQGVNTLPPIQSKVMREAIRHCQRAYPIETRVQGYYVALGAHALWALTGELGADDEGDDAEDIRANRGIHGWRGWTRPCVPQWNDRGHIGRVFVTYHPAYYYRAHWMKAVGRQDFRRLGRWLRSEWPEVAVPIIQDMPTRWPPEIAYDTEYTPDGHLTQVSLAWRGDDDTPHVHVVEPSQLDCRPAGDPPVVIMHNAEADWPYTPQVFGHEPTAWEDTMFAHGVLDGTLRHSLDFIGSLYARTDRWKHLEQSDPITYSGLDALGTWDSWRVLVRRLEGDSQSGAIYQDELKPLLRHLIRRPSIALHTGRLHEVASQLATQQAAILARGAAAAGWPLRVTSPLQVAKWTGVRAP